MAKSSVAQSQVAVSSVWRRPTDCGSAQNTFQSGLLVVQSQTLRLSSLRCLAVQDDAVCHTIAFGGRQKRPSETSRGNCLEEKRAQNHFGFGGCHCSAVGRHEENDDCHVVRRPITSVCRCHRHNRPHRPPQLSTSSTEEVTMSTDPPLR